MLSLVFHRRSVPASLQVWWFLSLCLGVHSFQKTSQTWLYLLSPLAQMFHLSFLSGPILYAYERGQSPEKQVIPKKKKSTTSIIFPWLYFLKHCHSLSLSLQLVIIKVHELRKISLMSKFNNKYLVLILLYIFIVWLFWMLPAFKFYPPLIFWTLTHSWAPTLWLFLCLLSYSSNSSFSVLWSLFHLF